MGLKCLVIFIVLFDHLLIIFLHIVSPHMIIEAVRHWLQQDIKRNIFDRVVFSSKANTSLVEKFMHASFPLYPSASRDSGASFGDPSQDQQNQNQNKEPLENGTTVQDDVRTDTTEAEVVDVQDVEVKVGEDQKELETKAPDNMSTEDLLESLQAIQDENIKMFDELVEKLATDSTPDVKPSVSTLEVISPQPELSSSLPSYQASDFFRRREFFESRSISPLSRTRHHRSQSGDHILNPDRTESDV